MKKLFAVFLFCLSPAMAVQDKCPVPVCFGVNWATATIVDIGRIDVDARNKRGWTPLHFATKYNNNPEIISALVNADANTNARSKKGHTPLHWAAENNTNPEIISALVNAGANINARSKIGWTPLHYAYLNKNPEIILALVSAGANINARVEGSGGTLLHYAARNIWNSVSIETFSILVSIGANINARDNTDSTPLHWAARNGDDPEIISALIKVGANIHARDEFGTTPLHDAADNSNPEIISVLIKNGAYVDARSDDGFTPLHWTIKGLIKPEIILALIKAGANVNALDKQGGTPLHWAAMNNEPQLIKILIKAGSDPKAKLNDGEIFTYFFGDKPDIQIGGWMPLHIAAKFGDTPEIIETLLKTGSDPKAKTNNGETAYDLIQKNEKLKDTSAYWKLHDLSFE